MCSVTVSGDGQRRCVSDMANTFTPYVSGSFSGEMIWNLTSYAVPDTIKKQLESVAIEYRDTHVLKMTGFDTYKYRARAIDTTEAFVDIDIMFVGRMDMRYTDQMRRLAAGCNGAGMQLLFRDDWITDRVYTGRWVNAGDFVESSALVAGMSMRLECWSFTDI